MPTENDGCLPSKSRVGLRKRFLINILKMSRVRDTREHCHRQRQRLRSTVSTNLQYLPPFRRRKTTNCSSHQRWIYICCTCSRRHRRGRCTWCAACRPASRPVPPAGTRAGGNVPERPAVARRCPRPRRSGRRRPSRHCRAIGDEAFRWRCTGGGFAATDKPQRAQCLLESSSGSRPLRSVLHGRLFIVSIWFAPAPPASLIRRRRCTDTWHKEIKRSDR